MRAREDGRAGDDPARTERVALDADDGDRGRQRRPILEQPGGDHLPLGVPGERLRQREQRLERAVAEASNQDRPQGRRRRHGVERAILAEDRPLEVLEPRPRLDPEPLDEHAPRVLVRVKRLGLASRAVEGEHQLAAQSLAERVGGDQRLELADELVVTAERELSLDAQLLRDELELLESGDRGLRERLVREVGERSAAPEGERLAELRRRLRDVPALKVAFGLGQQPLEPLQIQPVRPDADHVAGRLGHDHSPPAPSALRSFEIRTCSAGVPDSGGSSPQSSSIRRSLETTWFALRSRRASSARCLRSPECEHTVLVADLKRSQDPEVHPLLR